MRLDKPGRHPSTGERADCANCDRPAVAYWRTERGGNLFVCSECAAEHLPGLVADACHVWLPIDPTRQCTHPATAFAELWRQCESGFWLAVARNILRLLDLHNTLKRQQKYLRGSASRSRQKIEMKSRGRRAAISTVESTAQTAGQQAAVVASLNEWLTS